MVILNEFEIFLEDVFQKARISKSSSTQSFFYIHSLLVIFEKHAQIGWCTNWFKQKPSHRVQNLETNIMEEFQEWKLVESLSDGGEMHLKGDKVAKEDVKTKALKDYVEHMQVKVIMNMVVMTLKKAKIFEDYLALTIFTICKIALSSVE